jgi:hypothetical protein
VTPATMDDGARAATTARGRVLGRTRAAPPTAEAEQNVRAGDRDTAWRSLYKVAGVAAALTFLLVLADLLVGVLASEADVAPGALGAVGWFAELRERPLVGLRNLGILNVANVLLSLPLFAALWAAHRRHPEAPLAGLAAIVQIVGASVYVANNKALPLLSLSGRHAAAGSPDERSLLLAAGEALLAQGEDFTAGSFPGFLLSAAASLLIGLVLLRSGLFGRAAGWAGVVGPGLLLLFTVWVTFAPGAFAPAMAVAAVGGLASLAWYALLARGLLRLGGDPAAPAPSAGRAEAE